MIRRTRINITFLCALSFLFRPNITQQRDLHQFFHLYSFNPLKSSGYCMYHQISHSEVPRSAHRFRCVFSGSQNKLLLHI